MWNIKFKLVTFISKRSPKIQVIIMYCVTEILIVITLKILLCHLVPYYQN